MTDKMNPADREMLMAATLTSGLIDVETTSEQAVEVLQEVMFQIAVRGGTLKMRQTAREMAQERAQHQATSARKPR